MDAVFSLAGGREQKLLPIPLFLPPTLIKPLMFLLATHLALHFLQPPILALKPPTTKLSENPWMEIL